MREMGVDIILTQEGRIPFSDRGRAIRRNVTINLIKQVGPDLELTVLESMPTIHEKIRVREP